MAHPGKFLSGPLAYRVFLSFASAYFLSYAFRSVNAVIAPALMADLALSNADLGLLSAAYFVTFAGVQLPLGIWLDKYGARNTESVLLLLAAAGAAIFAMSSTLLELWMGRALIGAGVSACLMAPYKSFRQWFAPERQNQLMSWMMVAGTCGVLASTVPVTAAMPLLGWRGIFWIMAGLIVLSVTSIFFLVKPAEARMAAPVAPSAPDPSAPAQRDGYRRIFGDPYFRRLALAGSVNHGSFVALQTLWVGPWMITVLGMSKEQTSEILFAFNFCMLLAFLAQVWWAPRFISNDGGKGWPVAQVVGIGLVGTILVQAAMLMDSSPWTWLWWIPLGILFTVMILCQTQVSLAFPPSLAGRANSAYNLMVFIGAFAAQWGIGLLIDAFQARGLSPADALRAAFAVCIVLQAVAALVFMLNRTQPRRAIALQ